MIDSIIFDMDGTLWDATEEVAFAFNKVLKERYPEVTNVVTPELLQSYFGLPLDVIAVKMYTSVDESHAIEAMRECCLYECEYLAEYGAKLYDGLEEALQKLSKEYKLFIVSNCQEGYIQSFFRAYPQLQNYFVDFEYPGRSGKLKADNIRMIMERNQLENPIYVGDTQGDADAAAKAGVPFVFARYGYGDVENYHDVIDSLRELTEKYI